MTSKAERKRRKRGRPPRQGADREPNGRISRSTAEPLMPTPEQAARRAMANPAWRTSLETDDPIAYLGPHLAALQVEALLQARRVHVAGMRALCSKPRMPVPIGAMLPAAPTLGHAGEDADHNARCRREYADLTTLLAAWSRERRREAEALIDGPGASPPLWWTMSPPDIDDRASPRALAAYKARGDLWAICDALALHFGLMREAA